MNKLFGNIKDHYVNKGYTGIACGLRVIADGMMYICVLWYLVGAGCILPLYVRDYNSLGSDKGMAWINCFLIPGQILILAVAFLISAFFVKIMTLDGEAGRIKEKIKRTGLFDIITPVHIWSLLFLSSVLFSYIFSVNKDIALQGESGWYVGTESYAAITICLIVISYTGFAYGFFRRLILGASFVIYLIGIAMDLFGNIFSMDSWNSSKISTVGNANWFCGYLVTVYFIAMAAYLFEGRDGERFSTVKKWFFRIYLFAGAWMYVTNGSSSGYLSLAAVFIALLCFCKKDIKALLRVAEMGFIFSVAVVAHGLGVGICVPLRTNDAFGRAVDNLLIDLLLLALFTVIATCLDSAVRKGKDSLSFFVGKTVLIIAAAAVVLYFVLLIINTLSGGAVLGYQGAFFFDGTWGSYRGITLQLGVDVLKGYSFREWLFGTGPDTFYTIYTGGRYPKVLEQVYLYFGNSRLINTHCEPLTMLLNTGICGVVSFYGMMISFVVKGLKGRTGSREGTIAASAALCVLAYMVNNLFSFQTSVNLSQLSLMLAFGTAAVMRMKKREIK